jgi:hypothetical protein
LTLLPHLHLPLTRIALLTENKVDLAMVRHRSLLTQRRKALLTLHNYWDLTTLSETKVGLVFSVRKAQRTIKEVSKHVVIRLQADDSASPKGCTTDSVQDSRQYDLSSSQKNMAAKSFSNSLRGCNCRM